MEKPLPDIDAKTKEEAKKIYFHSTYRTDPVTLTPGQILILKTIQEDFQEALDKIGKLDPDIMFFILKLAEAEYKCTQKAAKKLGISPSTASVQLGRARYKLGAESNLQLLLKFAMTMQDFYERSNKCQSPSYSSSSR